MIKIKCAWCGKEYEIFPSRVKSKNFCSRACLADFSSKQKNPERYAELKNYDNMSKNMQRINEQLNPTRMNFSTRAKLHMAHRDSGSGKSYAKSFGVHTHRIVAERLLGRKLMPGEVVHHIDGNRRNNAPDNLMVFSSQSQHAKWHAEHSVREKGGDAK